MYWYHGSVTAGAACISAGNNRSSWSGTSAICSSKIIGNDSGCFVEVVGNGPHCKTGSSQTCVVNCYSENGMAERGALCESWNGSPSTENRSENGFLYSCEVPRSALVPLSRKQRRHAQKAADDIHWFKLFGNCPPDVLEKYWDQRYRLMSKFDDGILLDTESWYSITPEEISRSITDEVVFRKKLSGDGGGHTVSLVLDCFSGCGGNTIPFLCHKIPVVSVDIDEQKLLFLR